MCNKDSKVYTMLDTMGLVSKDSKPHSKILAVLSHPFFWTSPNGNCVFDIGATYIH